MTLYCDIIKLNIFCLKYEIEIKIGIRTKNNKTFFINIFQYSAYVNEAIEIYIFKSSLACNSFLRWITSLGKMDMRIPKGNHVKF